MSLTFIVEQKNVNSIYENIPIYPNPNNRLKPS